METRELIKKLRNYVGETDDIKLVNEAADKIEWLQNLEEDFIELIMKSAEVCSYCKHHIECKGKKCPKYIQGRKCWDDERCHHDWAWSCKDFNFGTCDMLENTPCNGCFENDNKSFEWRGNNV